MTTRTLPTAPTPPIGVLGCGSWGTALAIHLARKGERSVRLWARRREVAVELAEERSNPRYLPGVTFPPQIEVTAELSELVAADPILLAVPSHGLREVVRAFLAARRAAGRDEPVVLVSCTKGVEGESLLRMSEVCAQEAERSHQAARFAVLSGPTFAAEVAVGMPSAAVVASVDPELAASLREEFSDRRFRLYSSTDVVGVELGGAAKNVIAIGAGVVSGLGFGHNLLAALITRGLYELTRLGVACGGRLQTFSGLAGLGDLVLTCTGGLSRNRKTGLELAAGKSLAEITAATSMVAEGVRNSVAIARLAHSRGVEMPITEQMVAILYDGKPPREAVGELMTRALKVEWEL